MVETVKELKKLILEEISEDEFNEKYEKLCNTAEIYQQNKRAAYYIIAKEVGAAIKKKSGSSKEAHPLKIGELTNSEKTNFNVSGYLLQDFTQIINKNNNPMIFLQVADDTGITSVTVFSDGVENFFDDDQMPVVEKFDFVRLSNLSWKDKTVYNPNYGKYSSITKVEPEFDLSEVVVTPIEGMTYSSERRENFYFIKGIVIDLDDTYEEEIVHCETGHWFTDLQPKNEGEVIKCDKCDDQSEVLVSAFCKDITIADSDGMGIITAQLPVFARAKSVEENQLYLIRGEYLEDDMFNILSIDPLKKS